MKIAEKRLSAINEIIFIRLNKTPYLSAKRLVTLIKLSNNNIQLSNFVATLSYILDFGDKLLYKENRSDKSVKFSR